MLKVLEITEDNSNENIFKKQPPDVLYKKSVHKYLAKFIGKDLCQSHFSVDFAKFLRTFFPQSTSE